jgi:hypothetical protein
MSATVSELKTQLASVLATISGLRTYAYQPDQINIPMAWPILNSVEYHGAMSRGLITHNFTITCVVGRAAERSAQKTLDQYISYDDGVRAALEANPTLNGYAQSLIVESANDITTLDAGDTLYLTVSFRVVVYA